MHTKNKEVILNKFYNKTDDMHIWEFLVEYYKSKSGASFSRLPSRMLSKAFNLEEDESCKHTNYQFVGITLLRLR